MTLSNFEQMSPVNEAPLVGQADATQSAGPGRLDVTIATNCDGICYDED